jgi:type II protein arginine methyltransferase
MESRLTDADARLEQLCVPPALKPFALRCLTSPNPVRAVAEMLAVLRDKPPEDQLLACAMALNRAAPSDSMVRRMTASCIGGRIPSWHWTIVNDHRRNAAFQQAIDANIHPGMVVLEIGTGTGILAMMAARAGADHVFTAEVDPAIAEIARRNIARNGMEARITVFTGASHDLPKGALPARCDALVHEIMSTDLLSEALLPSVIHAREELLTHGAPLLPEKVRAIGAISTNTRRRPLMRAGEVCGFDLSAINDLARSVRSTGDTYSDALISTPEILLEIDLRTVPDDLRGRREIAFTPTADGMVEGVEQCIGFDFPGGAALDSTSHSGSSWGVHFHLFEEPMPACRDAAFSVAADYTPIALALSPA